MPDEHTTVMKILLTLEKSGVMKDLDAISDKTDDVIKKMIVDKLGAVEAAVDNTSGGSGKNEKGMFGKMGDTAMKTLGSIGGTVGKIFQGVTIVSGLFASFDIVLDMIGNAVKMMSTFFRPIAEIFMILIQPVFSMLRPLVQVFNTLMAPFRQIAMTGLAAANKLISTGMTMITQGQTAGGSALVGEGIQTAMGSAGLLANKMLELIFQPIANMLPFGDRFSSMMETLQSGSMNLIAKGILFSSTFDGVSSQLGNTNEAVVKTQEIFNTEWLKIQEKVGTFTSQNFIDEINKLTPVFTTVGTAAALAGNDKNVGALNTILDDLKIKSNAAGLSLETVVSGLSGLVDVASKLGKTDVNQQFDENKIQMNREIGAAKVSGGDKFLHTMLNHMNIIANGIGSVIPGYKSKPMIDDKRNEQIAQADALSKFVTSSKPLLDKMSGNDYAKANNDLAMASAMFLQLPNDITKGYTEMQNITNAYMGHSIIPDAFLSGFLHISDMTTQYMGPAGNISFTFSQGLTMMGGSMSNFKNQATQFTTLLQDATSRMRSLAQAYSNAVQQIDSMKRVAERRA